MAEDVARTVLEAEGCSMSIGVATIGFIIVVLLLIPILLWYAFVASIMWGWFIVPFFNAPPLSIWQMFAVALTLTAIRPKIDWHKSNEFDWEKIALIPLMPLITLALGAMTKFWMLS